MEQHARTHAGLWRRRWLPESLGLAHVRPGQAPGRIQAPQVRPVPNRWLNEVGLHCPWWHLKAIECCAAPVMCLANIHDAPASELIVLQAAYHSRGVEPPGRLSAVHQLLRWHSGRVGSLCGARCRGRSCPGGIRYHVHKLTVSKSVLGQAMPSKPSADLHGLSQKLAKFFAYLVCSSRMHGRLQVLHVVCCPCSMVHERCCMSMDMHACVEACLRLSTVQVMPRHLRICRRNCCSFMQDNQISRMCTGTHKYLACWYRLAWKASMHISLQT